MSNMNLQMHTAFNIITFYSHVQHTILCPTWIYELYATFSIMRFYFMSNIPFCVHHMFNVPFYVQYESTKCIWHSILLVFILMSTILFYVQHESTKCIGHSVSCVFILCQSYMYNVPFYVQHESTNAYGIQYYYFLFSCPTYYFMSNMNLRIICDI